MASVETPWFVLMVKPRHEKSVAASLRGKGYSVFLPLCEERSRAGNRNQIVQLPLFPTYVFCRLDPNNRLPVLTIPGVFYIVSVGKVPAPVDDKEIKSIQALVESGRNPLPCPYVEVGGLVKVICGPLQGLEGVLVGVRGKYRLVISVTLLRRSVYAEIDRDDVRPVIPRHPPASHVNTQLPAAVAVNR